MGRIKQAADIWLSFSYSKLKSLFNCPFQFQCQYVLKKPRPKPIILAVGSALHYLAHLNNKRLYQSADSFGKAWLGFWAGVVSGKHGPDSFRAPPEPIGWKSANEAGYWFQQGRKILEEYYRRHQDWRASLDQSITIALKSEYRLTGVSWEGFRLNGIIDRLDEYPDGVDIVDLKMGKDDLAVVSSSFQPLFYQIGYERRCRNKFCSGKPLRGFVIENLITGEIQRIPTSGADRLAEFTRYLREASDYIRAILTQDQTLVRRLIHLHPQDVENFRFFPRLPRNLHCKNCAYTADCLAWESDHGPPPRILWIDRFIAASEQPQPRQPDLPFGP